MHVEKGSGRFESIHTFRNAAVLNRARAGGLPKPIDGEIPDCVGHRLASFLCYSAEGQQLSRLAVFELQSSRRGRSVRRSATVVRGGPRLSPHGT